jgi:2-keto-3-deoxy-L-rhamnonate aldolase RhmA
MTERQRTLRERLRGGERLAVFWSSFGSPALVEVAVETGPDAVVLDVQHGLWSRGTLEEVLGAVGAATPVLVRTADGTAAAIGSALDAGAEGVIVPLVETGAQAAAAVAAARFPPEGRRSGGGVRPLKGDFAAYCARAGRRTVVGVMIETAGGVENAADIAATPGLDFVLIGTGDLALSLGIAAPADPRHEEACRAVFEACRAAAMPCAIFTPNAAEAARRAAQGYALTVAANDIGVVSSGVAAALAAFRKASA